MKKIVALIRPFDFQQDIYVFENGNKIDVKKVTLDEINKIIFELSDKYNLNEIELLGPKNFSRGLKKKIQEEEMLKYNKNKLKIKI